MNNDFILYRMLDKNGILLYVGISISLVSRISDHKRGKKWFFDVDTIKLERFKSNQELLEAERFAIKNEHPKFNLAHTEKRKKCNPNSDFKVSELIKIFGTTENISKAVGRSETTVKKWIDSNRTYVPISSKYRVLRAITGARK